MARRRTPARAVGAHCFRRRQALGCALLGFAGAVSTRLPAVAAGGYAFSVGCVALAVGLVLLPQQRRRLNRCAVIAFLPGLVLIGVGVLAPPARPAQRGCAPTDTSPLCRSASH